jgi:hypothetical protein
VVGDGNTPQAECCRQLAVHLPAATAVEAAGFVEQLSIFDRSCLGRVFSTVSTEAPFGSRTIFVEEMVWQVLEASSAEVAARASD